MPKIVKERGNPFFRLLDWYAGIFLILVLSIFKRKNSNHYSGKTPSSIIFIKMGAIGDSILTIPFIERLKKENADMGVSVICGQNNRAVYQGFAGHQIIDNIIDVEFSKLIYNWAYLRRKIKEIRSLEYDVCVDFDSWYRISALISFLVKADYKIGFKKEKQYKHYLFDSAEMHRSRCHEFENYGHLISPYISGVPQAPNFGVEEKHAIYCREYLSAHGIEQYIVFHPWASGYKSSLKELDKSSMVFIGNNLASHGYTIIITGGKDDVEKSANFSTLVSGSYSIAGQTSLGETAEYLRNACCVVTVNTGIMHLAAAVNSKIVSINGPTNINRWGPLSKNAINITSSLFCSPCLDLGFEYKCKQHSVPEGHCMQQINTGEVVDAALKMAGLSKTNKITNPDF